MRLLIGLFEIQIFNELSLEILLIVIASCTKIWVLKFAFITLQEHVFKVYVLKLSASDASSHLQHLPWEKPVTKREFESTKSLSSDFPQILGVRYPKGQYIKKIWWWWTWWNTTGQNVSSCACFYSKVKNKDTIIKVCLFVYYYRKNHRQSWFFFNELLS